MGFWISGGYFGNVLIVIVGKASGQMVDLVKAKKKQKKN
jgi:hypothetical protein